VSGSQDGIQKFQDIGFAGGSYLSEYASNNNLINETNRNASSAYIDTTERGYESTASTYEPVSVSATQSSGESGTSVQVQVSVNPQFSIQGGNGQSEEDIMQVIKKHMKEMADELGGEIAGKLEEVFSNMPLKEA
jgi:hypothetical protein